MTFLNKRAKFAGLASVALAATSAAVLFASQAAFATTTPGDNGTVKVHDSSTSVTDYQNDPHDVCQFYLDGFNFDGAQSVTWYIDSWSPTGGNGPEVLNGTLTIGADGDGYTDNQSLPNGHYKLFWNFAGENGAAKQKVFWVNCPAPAPTTPTTPPTTTPPSSNCTCHSTPPTKPTVPATQTSSSTSSSQVKAAPAPVAVTGNLPVTG